MTLTRAFKFIAVLFCATSTLCFFVLGIQAVFFYSETSYSGADIFRVFALTLSVALPILVFVRSEKASYMELIIRRAIHFCLTSALVFGCLVNFKWMYAANSLAIIAVFLVGYVAGFIIFERRERKLADELNKQINAFHRGKSQNQPNAQMSEAGK